MNKPIDPFTTERRKMVCDQIAARGIRSPELLRAFETVPRHEFVPMNYRDESYSDKALSLAAGQTVSQPYMVAAMTDQLRVKPGDKILEIGTGSGYQTAILAALGAQVFTIERLPELQHNAHDLLDRLGFRRIHYAAGDGTLGWPQHAPYQGIIVTAGAPAAPQSLLSQLADKGRLVIPVGSREEQNLVVIQRHGDQYAQETLFGCRFVPLIGKEGWPQ